MNDSLLDQAVNHHKNGELDKAEQLYMQLLSIDNPQLAVIHNLGIININKGQLKTGIELISRVVKNNPDNPELNDTYKVVASALFNANHWEVAHEWLVAALKVQPNDPELKAMLDRVQPRDYLKPEIYDPIAAQTLLRYSPREAPTYVYTIDISGTCNLRCPSCPVGNLTHINRDVGFMSIDLFKKIIQKIQTEKVIDHPQIWLYNWGEPLLHPKLNEIIKIVKNEGLSVYISSNLNTEHGIQSLAQANPNEIKISLSGFTQETYEKTHKRGNITILKANMYLLRYYLNKYRSTTHVWVNQHLYKHNSDQTEQIKAVCSELSFEYYPIQAFFQPLEKVIDLIEGKAHQEDEQLLDLLLMRPEDTLNNIKKHRTGYFDCELRFNQTVINHDGSLALCCSTYTQANMLGINFLDHPHSEIEKKKYQHNFCSKCRLHGADYSVSTVMNRMQTYT